MMFHQQKRVNRIRAMREIYIKSDVKWRAGLKGPEAIQFVNC